MSDTVNVYAVGDNLVQPVTVASAGILSEPFVSSDLECSIRYMSSTSDYFVLVLRLKPTPSPAAPTPSGDDGTGDV